MNKNVYVGKQVQRLRPLWEEVFCEDSAIFTEYYFREKAENNIAFVMEEADEPVAMVHLTPYLTNRGEEVCYIVGVATKQKFRRQGLMEELLKEAFTCMKSEGEPFTFLMPANPAIYTPYGFAYIYEKREASVTEDLKNIITKLKDSKEANCLSYRFCMAQPKDDVIVAAYANKELKRSFGLYMQRNAVYYRRMRAELQSQNGGLIIIKKEGIISGLCAYTEENQIEIQELLCDFELRSALVTEDVSHKKPYIMARILDVKAMFSKVYSEQEFVLSVSIKDEQVIENNGIFMLHCGPTGGYLHAVSIAYDENQGKERCAAECEVEISRLTKFLFGASDAKEAFHVFAKSRETEIYQALNRLHVCKNVCINEIV